MFNLKLLQRSKTVKYGVPMLLLVVGGSFGLREFSQIRYDSQKIRRRIFVNFPHFWHPQFVCEVQVRLLTPPQQLDPSLEAKVNVQRQSVILEEEYEKIKEMNLDEWKNIRGPRPWEDSREYQEQQRRKLSNKD